MRKAVLTIAMLAGAASPAAAQESEDLAQKVANPVASLISVPLQSNIDCCFGPEDRVRYTLNIQPVIPVALSKDWNVIVRTIVPIISQEQSVTGTGGATGFGDVTQSFFFSPKASSSGITWGVGPAFLWPTGKSALGTEKWGAGPTAIVLKQTRSRLTFGLLVNHIWSYAGDDKRDDISTTFIQPFFSKNLKDSTSFTVNSEMSYDWEHKEWTIPINFTVGRLYKIGKQPVQIAGGGRYYADSPPDGPKWGVRLTLSFLFPG